MTPKERMEFNQMKANIEKILGVLDVNFIENIKRRAVDPKIKDLGLDSTVSKTGEGNTSGVTQSVDEAGASLYNVAKTYNGTITVRDTDGNSYKLGYYTA